MQMNRSTRYKKNLPNFPFKFRKSEYFDNEKIRDMIYKGYTVIYRVNEVENSIDIVRIFHKNKPPYNQ